MTGFQVPGSLGISQHHFSGIIHGNTNRWQMILHHKYTHMLISHHNTGHSRSQSLEYRNHRCWSMLIWPTGLNLNKNIYEKYLYRLFLRVRWVFVLLALWGWHLYCDRYAMPFWSNLLHVWTWLEIFSGATKFYFPLLQVRLQVRKERNLSWCGKVFQQRRSSLAAVKPLFRLALPVESHAGAG